MQLPLEQEQIVPGQNAQCYVLCHGETSKQILEELNVETLPGLSMMLNMRPETMMELALDPLSAGITEWPVKLSSHRTMLGLHGCLRAPKLSCFKFANPYVLFIGRPPERTKFHVTVFGEVEVTLQQGQLNGGIGIFALAGAVRVHFSVIILLGFIRCVCYLIPYHELLCMLRFSNMACFRHGAGCAS